MIAGLAERARGVASAVGRGTPVPFAVRCGVFLAGVAAVAIAFPGYVIFSRPGSLLLLAPLLPAVLPRGRATTAVALLVVFGWLVDTAPSGEPVGLTRLLALAAALYLTHSLAALAAILPYDAVVPLEVAARWLGRALGVVLAAAVLAVTALAAASRSGDRSLLVASLSGLVLGVAAVFLLVWLWRRR